MPSIGIKKKKKGEEKPAAEGAATEEGGEAPESGKKKKEKGSGGKSKIITWVLIIVLVAAALFAGGVLMTKILLPSIVKGMYNDLGNMPSEGQTDMPEQNIETEPLKLVATHPLDEMTIQLSPSQNGVASYLVTEIGVGFTNKKDAGKFAEKKLEIQDIVLSTLMSKTKEELSSLNDVEALKKVLAGKISKLFSEKNQIQIVISKFLIQ